MKKMFLSFVVAIISTTAMFAQNTLVATLTHGDDVTMFYGVNALREAHGAATSGDVINLSGGAFQSVNITKAVTIRGAGIDSTNPTYINGGFQINISEEDTGRLSMEGIRCVDFISVYGTSSNAYFLKCKFYSFSFNESAFKNTMFANCKITNSIVLNGTNTAQFINSYVSFFSSYDNASATFVNCVLMTDGYSNGCSYICNSQLQNCIINPSTSYRVGNLPSTSQASNCVVVNYGSIFNQSQANIGCIGDVSYADMFKDYTGTYSDDQTFELTDEAKAMYLGTDGTEIGMYGGLMPYNSTPTYPQITKMNVAKKTTADGKLSVEIEVSAAE